jgi:hypothetical protein
MSAELYDAEIAGALARPAIDVLPQASAKKAKTDTDGAGAEFAAVAADQPPADISTAEEPQADVTFAPPSEATAEPSPSIDAAPAEAADAAPRKVFGIALGRGRRAKATDEAVDGPVDETAPEAPVLEGTDAPPVAITSDVTADVEITSAEITSTIDPFAPVPPVAPVVDEAPAAPPVEAVTEPAPQEASFAEAAPTLAAPVPDHTEEVRAMRALLEASEQVRQAAEQRTADAESQLRTVTNAVQEWQIRHREAEATITELAGSLAGAEGRMSELAQRLAAAEAERDELVSALDAATSPAN